MADTEIRGAHINPVEREDRHL